MNKVKRCKLLPVAIVFISVFLIALMGYRKFSDNIPNNIRIVVNQLESFNFSLPIEADINGENVDVLNIHNATIQNKNIHFNLNRPFTIQSSQKGRYKIKLKLFGVFKIKEIQLDVIDQMSLTPCGIPIGIYVETDGVMVLGTGTIAGNDGLNYEPALNIIKSGDYITAVNSKGIRSIEDLKEAIQKSKGKNIHMTIRRNKNSVKVNINPVKSSDGYYKIGVWIRDSTQGIGTLTYIDLNHNFGALGHGITDVDTGLLMEIRKGAIYRTDILQILKGETGKPGELVGLINLDNNYKIGDIKSNSYQGIFGDIDVFHSDSEYLTSMPIGLKQEIKLGKAYVLCEVNDKVNKYEIEIKKIELNTANHSKGLVIQIKDNRLLKITNGIVQGMSGSPIIQNGKIIGAVTHVFIQDSTKGYGTFIENMLQFSD